MKDSKKLWISIERESGVKPLTIGKHTSYSLVHDPIRLSFVTARYKFCARLLSGMDRVLEIGCGDGFGSTIVAKEVGKLICTDINEPMLEDAKEQLFFLDNTFFEYHDFRQSPYPESVDAIFLVDTLEHIYAEEEKAFMENICKSLGKNGTCIIGTPNKTAEKYASEGSKKGHVNLKDFESLKALTATYFHNTFHFGMNDEMIHTGFPPMTHYRWSLSTSPKIFAGQEGQLSSDPEINTIIE
ncbi:MAG: class I SAM-dependent methyltransferase [Proteobacteria bacterium]|nr:class I SAM-dependent methyltransferase [Desulfobacula sp.]MBU3951753.1 class I SAM-dependent methyltransferase [Pseudomonadota bacterium]